MAALIIRHRKQRGWSQIELAERANCSQQLIGKIETGKVKETKKLPGIARAFGLTVEQLLAGTDGPVPIERHPKYRHTWPFDIAYSRFAALPARVKGRIELLVEKEIERYEGRRTIAASKSES